LKHRGYSKKSRRKSEFSRSKEKRLRESGRKKKKLDCWPSRRQRKKD
jgi:hypothetical protein